MRGLAVSTLLATLLVMSLDSCGSRDSDADAVVVSQGVAQSGAAWKLSYSPSGGRHCLQFSADGARVGDVCGFDIPKKTEIGFGAGLKPGVGDYFFFGITTNRIVSVIAKSRAGDSEVETEPLPSHLSQQKLRTFVLTRKPIEDVDALVGLDAKGNVVQRIALAHP